MASIDDLVHTMNENARKAAMLYAFGEYKQGDHYAHVAERASDAIERQAVHREFASTAESQAAALRERGVS